MKSFTKKLSLLVAAFAAVAVMAPDLASAHGNGRGGSDKDGRKGGWGEWRRGVEAGTVNEFGVRVFDAEKNNSNGNARKHGHYKKFMGNLFFNGTITAVSDTGFTVDTAGKGSLTVNTGSAQLFRMPKEEIALVDLAVGDRVFITGTKDGSTVAASAVYAKPAHIDPAVAKGKVTASTENTLTVQTKNGSEVTVNTDADTQVWEDGEVVSLEDVTVGSKVKIFGLWDSIVNVFTALKIAIK